MALTTVQVPNFDPQCAVSVPQRSVQGIVKAEAVVLDQEFPQYARWILLDVTGALSYVGWDDITVVIPVLSAGVFHPIYAKKVNSSGTTATNLVWGN